MTSLGIFLALIETSESGISDGTLQHLLKVNKPETARAILAAILGGMISLTVFSFSMMMVVVNQASSNFSPKVVELFLNNRSNQFIMGVYVGTIVFILMAMVQIESKAIPKEVPNRGLILSILFTIFSIFLFIKFINNISNSAKIHSILKTIYSKTQKGLNNRSKYDYKDDQEPEVLEWKDFVGNKSGYFQDVRISQLLKILKKEDLILKVIPQPGYYFTSCSPLFALNREIKDEELLENIRSNFITYTGEDISENDFYGFRQLREIAVKGLSPGINDPGIARICIDYLGDLLASYMKKPNNKVVADDIGKPRILLNKYELPALMEFCFTPIKAYAKKDYTIQIALLKTLLHLSYHDDKNKHREVIVEQAISVIEDADLCIFNSLERKFINMTIKDLNTYGYFSFPLMEMNSESNWKKRHDSA